jgi:ribosomal protein S27AE
MREDLYAKLTPVEDAALAIADKVLEDGKLLEAIKAAMLTAAKGLPETYSVDFKLELTVFDSDRERALPIMRHGLTCGNVGKPYRAYGDSSEQRYWVKGELCKVPHDHCPNCWGLWDFKFKNRECADCGFMMGRDVKELLDDDQCPHCNEGKVTRLKPVCTKCGQSVDLNDIWWG